MTELTPVPPTSRHSMDQKKQKKQNLSSYLPQYNRPFSLKQVFWQLLYLPVSKERVVSFGLKLLKTFESIALKIIEVIGTYKIQKSIVVIPSLTTQNYSFIQIVVYNGTIEEVLGFRQRGFISRILKGVPDFERFECLECQFPKDKTDKIKEMTVSTSHRGFVFLQLPWGVSLQQAKSNFTVTPKGTETLFGNIKLGDYEIHQNSMFCIDESIKWVIISDIDDTIKDSKISETTTWPKILRAIFLGHYYRYDPVLGMPTLYSLLVKKHGLIVYVTSTPLPLAPFLLKFLKVNDFPEGPVYLRNLKYNQLRHKWMVVSRLLESLTTQKCILIGDSGESDLLIYRRLNSIPHLSKKIFKICIRELPHRPAQKANHPKEFFFKDISVLQTFLDSAMM